MGRGTFPGQGGLATSGTVGREQKMGLELAVMLIQALSPEQCRAPRGDLILSTPIEAAAALPWGRR